MVNIDLNNYIPITMNKIKMNYNINISKDMKQLELSNIAAGNIK